MEYLKSRDISVSVKEFTGIEYNDLPMFEDCFQTNVNVFSLTEDHTAHSEYVSRCRYPGKPMLVNLYENHFSFIKNEKKFCKRYQCHNCDRLFNRIDTVKET